MWVSNIQSVNNVSLYSQTQSVNVRGPSSLSPGLARCQTTFLRQLPFFTSAALTWFHLTVVRNLFSFSVMKYYTETPALLSSVSYLWSPGCHYVLSGCGFCFTLQHCCCCCYNSWWLVETLAALIRFPTASWCGHWLQNIAREQTDKRNWSCTL